MLAFQSQGGPSETPTPETCLPSVDRLVKVKNGAEKPAPASLVTVTSSLKVPAANAAACRRDGRVVVADAAFAAFDLPTPALAAALRSDGSGSPRLSAIVDDVAGRPVALAVAPSARALSWPLDPAVRVALSSGAADY